MSLPEACECSVMTGASSTTDGTEGYVPAPKIGDEGKFLRGDGTWATIETSSKTKVYEVEIIAGADHETAIATIVGENELQDGDIAIVKELINGKKREYTAYVYYNNEWKAMDGNYNAENVYFDEDIIITTNVGNIEVENGNGSIPAAGKNLKQVFEAMYTKEDLDLAIDTPSISFSLSNSGNASGEVGSAITLPTATLTISDIGSYEYGSKDNEGNIYTKEDGTGVVFTNLKTGFGTKVSEAVEGAYTEEKDIEWASGSISYTAKDTQITEPLFLDSAKTYTFSYSATYKNKENPRKPITNLGNFINTDGISTAEYAEGTKAINQNETNYEKTITGSSNWKATGYRKWFWGYMSDEDALADPTKITSKQIRNLQNSKGSTMNTYTQASPWVVPAGTKQIYIAIPSGKQTKSLTINNWSSLGSEVANTKMDTTIDVADARGTSDDGTLNGATAYNIWYVNLDSGFGSDAKLALTWA